MKSENKMEVSTYAIIPKCRKIRKPLMEKKRRARINDSLEMLKKVLLENKSNLKEHFCGDKSNQRIAKLEKADILEMTVLYIEYLRNKIKSNQAIEQTLPSSTKASFIVNSQKQQEINIKKNYEKNVFIRPTDSSYNNDLKLEITLVPTKLLNGDITFIIPTHVTSDAAIQQDVVWRPW